MKTNKKRMLTQRQIIEKKLLPWARLRQESRPPAGWLKAIRGSLGITTRQLADHLGVTHSTILQLEKREVKGTASFEILNKVANVMGCKLIYAIVPQDSYTNLDDILTEKAHLAGQEILRRAEHTMRLEAQGNSTKSSQTQLNELISELKTNSDSRVWDKKAKIKEKTKKPK